MGHVFKNMEIQDSSACEVNCFMEGDCVSFNVKPLQGRKYACQLSNSSDVVYPEDLKDEQGAVYTSFKVSLTVLFFFIARVVLKICEYD